MRQSARSNDESGSGSVESSRVEVSTLRICRRRSRPGTPASPPYECGPARRRTESSPHELVKVASRLVDYLVVGGRDPFTNVNCLQLVNGIARDHCDATARGLGVEAGGGVATAQDSPSKVVAAQREHAAILVKRPTPGNDLFQCEHLPSLRYGEPRPTPTSVLRSRTWLPFSGSAGVSNGSPAHIEPSSNAPHGRTGLRVPRQRRGRSAHARTIAQRQRWRFLPTSNPRHASRFSREEGYTSAWSPARAGVEAGGLRFIVPCCGTHRRF